MLLNSIYLNNVEVIVKMDEKQSQPIRGYKDYLIYEDGAILNLKCGIFIQGDEGKVRLGSKIFAIDRIVASHFLPLSNEMQTIRHIDGNLENNLASNLCWDKTPELLCPRTPANTDYRRLDELKEPPPGFKFPRINRFCPIRDGWDHLQANYDAHEPQPNGGPQFYETIPSHFDILGSRNVKQVAEELARSHAAFIFETGTPIGPTGATGATGWHPNSRIVSD